MAELARETRMNSRTTWVHGACTTAGIVLAFRTVSGSGSSPVVAPHAATGVAEILLLAMASVLFGGIGWHHWLRSRGASSHLGMTLRCWAWGLGWGRPGLDFEGPARRMATWVSEAMVPGPSRGSHRDRVAALLWFAAGEGVGCAGFATALGLVGAGPADRTTAWILSVILGWTLGRCLGVVGGLGPRELLLIGATSASGPSAARILAAGGLWTVLRMVRLALGRAWLRAECRRRATSTPARAGSLSIVMPVLNESEAIAETVRRARAVPGVMEVLVVDGGSRDDTRAQAAGAGARVIDSAPGRGIQMRLGAAQARGDVVLFLHADTWLEPDAWDAIRRCLADRTVVAGGFWKRFRRTPWLMLGSRPKCAVRLLVGRRIVGDMAMFVRRDALERIGGVPSMELMEDFELSRRLRGVGRLALADSTVTTSARRFEQRGVIATYLRMWWVATLYRMGKPPADLRRIYG